MAVAIAAVSMGLLGLAVVQSQESQDPSEVESPFDDAMREGSQALAEKDKAKEAKKAEKAASSSSDEAEKRAPKRKRSDAEEGSPTPASSPAKPAESSEEKQDKPKVKRVRKEKSAPKPREALGLAVEEMVIGVFQPALGDNWDSMAQ